MAIVVALAATVLTGKAEARAGKAQPAVLQQYDRLMEEGVLNNGLGRFRLAESAFRNAFDICERAFGYGRNQCGEALLRVALEVSNQSRFVEADLIFRRVLNLISRKRQPLAHARALTYRALHFSNRGRHKPAFDMVVDANKRRKSIIKATLARAQAANPAAQKELETAMADLAHGLFAQATIAFEMNRLKEAELTAQLSRRLITRIDAAPNWWLAFVDELLAKIDRRHGRHAEAEKRLRMALKTKELAFGNTRPAALTRLALGSVYSAGSRPAPALSTMRPGLAIVRSELDRAPGISLEQIIPFLDAAYIEAGRRPALRKKLYAEMFGASQLARSESIARSLAAMAARYSARNPRTATLVRRAQDLAQRRDNLRLRLGQAAIALGGKPDMASVHRLRAAYAKAAGDAAVAESDLLDDFPDYAAFVSGLPVSVQELDGLLAPDEALVRFVIGAKGGFAFLYRRGALHVARINIGAARLDRAIRTLRAPFESAGKRIPPFNMAAAHRLYRDLFGPLSWHLRGARHIVSVSSGAMLSLPLSLLITRPPRGNAKNYAQAAWFARHAAFSYMPSVRAFVAMRMAGRDASRPDSFIGLGSPVLTGSKGKDGMASLSRHCQVGRPVPPKLIRALDPLPETKRELQAVAKAIGAPKTRLLLGPGASEPELRRARLEDYGIVYFATHGLLPGELRCQSDPALVLTPPRRATARKSDDGLLDSSEIASLKLDADLVVLSACNTGGGSAKGPLGGDSLSGLAQAFFQAGARALIVSHWQVDSTATARLMIATFRINSGGDPSISYSRALQNAQLRMIRNRKTAHPFFWAAFTYIGAGRPPAGA